MQFLYQLVFYILLSVSLSSHSSQLDNTFHQNILTKEEQAYLKKHPVIKVQCISDTAPYNFVKNGKPQGFSIDHIQLLASKINLKVEIITGYTWNQYLELMKEKKIDVMLNIVKNNDREKYFLFTSSYFSVVNTMFTKKGFQYDSLSDFNGKTISVVKGFSEIVLLKQLFPNIHLLIGNYSDTRIIGNNGTALADR